MRITTIMGALAALSTSAVTVLANIQSTKHLVRGAGSSNTGPANNQIPGTVLASFYLNVSGPDFPKITGSPYGGDQIDPLNGQFFVGNVAVEICGSQCTYGSFSYAVMQLIQDQNARVLAFNSSMAQQIYVDPVGALRYWSPPLGTYLDSDSWDNNIIGDFKIINSTTAGYNGTTAEVLVVGPRAVGKRWPWYLCPFGTGYNPQQIFVGRPGFVKQPGCVEFQAAVQRATGGVQQYT